MKLSKEELDLLGQLDAWEGLINEPFTYVPGMLLFREEKQREAHARGKVFQQAEFDKVARALGLALVERHRKMRAARFRRYAAAADARAATVPTVTTVAVPATAPDPKSQAPSAA